jgi:hypothetical protein
MDEPIVLRAKEATVSMSPMDNFDDTFFVSIGNPGCSIYFGLTEAELRKLLDNINKLLEVSA